MNNFARLPLIGKIIALAVLAVLAWIALPAMFNAHDNDRPTEKSMPAPTPKAEEATGHGELVFHDVPVSNAADITVTLPFGFFPRQDQEFLGLPSKDGSGYEVMVQKRPGSLDFEWYDPGKPPREGMVLGWVDPKQRLLVDETYDGKKDPDGNDFFHVTRVVEIGKKFMVMGVELTIRPYDEEKTFSMWGEDFARPLRSDYDEFHRLIK